MILLKKCITGRSIAHAVHTKPTTMSATTMYAYPSDAYKLNSLHVILISKAFLLYFERINVTIKRYYLYLKRIE